MKILNFDDKGQSLIEVLIAVAVGTVIIASLLGLATRSNRNANFARASGQASKLAQQGLEIVRNIETLNETGAIKSPPLADLCTAATCDKWTDLYNYDLGLGNNDLRVFSLVDNVADPSCSGWCLVDSTPPPEEITHDNFNFERTVEISDTPRDTTGISDCHTTIPPPPVSNGFDFHDAKQVTVKVTWDDPTGSHEVSVSTCINNL